MNRPGSTPFPIAAAFEKLLTMTVFRLDFVNDHTFF
jgi:hypothetical protein